MSSDAAANAVITNSDGDNLNDNEKGPGRKASRIWPWGRRAVAQPSPEDEFDADGMRRPTKWSMGVLNDPWTHEVPGSVLLLTGHRIEPLGLRNAPARTSHSSLPPQSPVHSRPHLGSRRSSRHSARQTRQPELKRTEDGAIILDPQPDDSKSDPLNWPAWRRDAALLSLGIYCMLGGGMTPILAAGFTDVSATFDVSTEKVALTTGLFMMGLGVGSVLFSPTAILWGKRPVYLFAAIMFCCASIWCATAKSFPSLLLARIFMGIAVSPVECLPSATIAEIFFLHERAYRLGIYTLLLLGGKNLSPLASAAVIQSKGWRWVFWIVAIIVGAFFFLLFLFVPETFWDRTRSRKAPSLNPASQGAAHPDHKHHDDDQHHDDAPPTPQRPKVAHRPTQNLHVGFAAPEDEKSSGVLGSPMGNEGAALESSHLSEPRPEQHPETASTAAQADEASSQPAHLQVPGDVNSASRPQTPHFLATPDVETASGYFPPVHRQDSGLDANADEVPLDSGLYTQGLRPWNGRLHYDNWFRVALRPFILFAYPAVLWSAAVYSCSVGWLIVLSESVSVVYRSADTYNFSALSAGLIYISPFVGGVLGTAVAGRVSDVIVLAMTRRNGGLYEPEFRLVMTVPIAATTVIGLMGYGWSVEVHDQWIVPTVFFGIISFGCSLGSTTSITFCVDSYRQYAGEALVTLNFSKNILHGLVFSLFFNNWLHSSGSKSVFIWLGVIQLILLTGTIPMYIFGKRARMWTARRNLMENF